MWSHSNHTQHKVDVVPGNYRCCRGAIQSQYVCNLPLNNHKYGTEFTLTFKSHGGEACSIIRRSNPISLFHSDSLSLLRVSLPRSPSAPRYPPTLIPTRDGNKNMYVLRSRERERGGTKHPCHRFTFFVSFFISLSISISLSSTNVHAMLTRRAVLAIVVVVVFCACLMPEPAESLSVSKHHHKHHRRHNKHHQTHARHEAHVRHEHHRHNRMSLFVWCLSST